MKTLKLTNMKLTNIEIHYFGQLPSGQKTSLYTLKNAKGMTVKIADFGATIVSISVADKNGIFDDITHGCDSLEGYLKGVPYFGATVGRYGNRIGNATFKLDDETYHLAKNNGVNTLHGGLVGFDKAIWQVNITDGEEPSLSFSHTSPDGDEGFPGQLSLEVVFTLSNDNSLTINYKAKTNKATVLNITNHSYFNLSGGTNIMEHQVKLNADKYLPVDNNIVPTGEMRSVKDTPFDFIQFHVIGERINDIYDEQIVLGEGYDHCFVINEQRNKLKKAATVYEPISGRIMDVFTTEPGLQFYTANHLDGSIIGKKGEAYTYRSGFCVETQHFPDSPNQSTFPSTVLRPKETFRSTTKFKFSVKE
jgi:aldose 1-epimerase